MSKAILDALKTRLYASTSLMTALGNRAYLDSGPVNAALPLLVYRSTGVRTTPIFGSVTRYDLDFEFQFFFNNTGTQDIHTVSALLKTALSTPLSPTGFDRATFVRGEAGAPSFSDDSWTMIETYRAIAFDT